MSSHYTDEKNTLILIALLKAHGIRRVVASPGSASISFVISIQSDPHFELYSSVDERSAAYIACGMAAESGEPVVIACTGATASRNYLSGLTEAYYRKLPILSVTATQDIAKVGHHIPQVIDRSVMPRDTIRHSVTLPIVKDDNDQWDCEIKVNNAILELFRHGGGPVHINNPVHSRTFGATELPRPRVINRVTATSTFPEMPSGRIAVAIGTHKTMTQEETEALDRFCASNNAVVFCDHTSAYRGKYRVLFSLTASQSMFDRAEVIPDLMIHIGEICGDYSIVHLVGKEVWRVSEDGEIRDTFRKLRYVFEMPEQHFFECYAKTGRADGSRYYQNFKKKIDKVNNDVPDCAFSHVWVASKMAKSLPENSTIHFGILSSLRSWNFFEIPDSVISESNVGGFGIDGCVSSLFGASLVNKDKLYFGVFGDLSFFYDMNVIGNRSIGNNLRILMVNNGEGLEFRLTGSPGFLFGEDTSKFISAAQHFGNQSRSLVKNFVQDLGFEYLCASNKDEFNQVYQRFLTPEITDRPIFFEVFTSIEDDIAALDATKSIADNLKGQAKQMTKRFLGDENARRLKRFIGIN